MKTLIKNKIGNEQIGPFYWVGHCSNGVQYFAGQTFRSNTSGKLAYIKLFPVIVMGATAATLTIYELDDQTQQWKEQKASFKTIVNKAMEGHWLQFGISDVHIKANKQYGFKLSCDNGGMMAIAENPWTVPNPYSDGQEWVGSSENPNGSFHKDFDLAFEAAVE